MDYPGYGDFHARREQSLWQRLNRILAALLLLAGVLMTMTLFLPRYKQLTQSHEQIEALQAQVNEQKSQLARRTREVNLLKNDPEYLEVIARDRLDLMKDGETIVRLESPAPQRHAPKK